MAMKSFKLKLILSYALVILVSFGFIAFFLDRNLRNNSLHNIETSLVNQAYLVASQITAENMRNEDTARLEPLAAALGRKINCRITVINSFGKVLADSDKPQDEISRMENHLYRSEVKLALAGKVGVDTRYSSTLKIDMLYVALPLKDKSEVLGALRLALPLASVRES